MDQWVTRGGERGEGGREIPEVWGGGGEGGGGHAHGLAGKCMCVEHACCAGKYMCRSTYVNYAEEDMCILRREIDVCIVQGNRCVYCAEKVMCVGRNVCIVQGKRCVYCGEEEMCVLCRERNE
jgi:hypothetical protein